MGMDLDEDLIDKELIELQQESQEHDDTPSHLQRLHSINTQNLMAMDLNDDDESNFHTSLGSDDGSQCSEVNALHSAYIFNASILAEIRNCIANVMIPSWVNRPPANLSDKSHGKLKADHWLILFTVIFSIILPEIWSRTKSQHNLALLKNPHNVTTCTHIVISYMTSLELTNTFSAHYHDY